MCTGTKVRGDKNINIGIEKAFKSIKETTNHLKHLHAKLPKSMHVLHAVRVICSRHDPAACSADRTL